MSDLESYQPGKSLSFLMLHLKVRDNLYLQLLSPAHSQALFNLIDQNRQHLGQWMPFIQGIQQKQDAYYFIASALKEYENTNGFQLGLWLNNTLIGVMGLHLIEWHALKTSIGYWIAQAYEGKGFITDACRSLIHYTFVQMGLNRIEVKLPPDNSKSQAIPKRLGFRYEGLLRQDEWLNGQFIDLAVWGLLKKEWKPE